MVQGEERRVDKCAGRTGRNQFGVYLVSSVVSQLVCCIFAEANGAEPPVARNVDSHTDFDGECVRAPRSRALLPLHSSERENSPSGLLSRERGSILRAVGVNS